MLTLGTVGVINLYTQVHVHTTKLFWPATYMSSWAGYFSRLAMVYRSPLPLCSFLCLNGVGYIRAGYSFIFTFHVQPPLVRTKMNEVEAYNIHITEFDILLGPK